MTPCPAGQQVPERYQHNRANQRPEDGNASHCNIANATKDDDLRHQPGPYEARNDRTYDSERKPPADEEFCHESDQAPNDKIHDEIGSKRPGIIAKPEGDTVCENSAIDEEMEHAILL